MTFLSSLKKELLSIADPKRAVDSARYFKTGKGEYGEGDIFIGIKVPDQRKICKKYTALSLTDIEKLLRLPEHEFRTCALFILTEKFKKADSKAKRQIYNFYLKNTKYINNWDLVDGSASYIVGEYLDGNKDKMKVLRRLAKSKYLWEKRIAIISTFAYIKKGRSEEAIEIAELLMRDPHDLIHKAIGWMLREIGKNISTKALCNFLNTHVKTMPRTTLRYALERLPAEKRKHYMKIKSTR